MSDLRQSRLSINGVAGVVTEAGDSESTEAIVCLHGVPGSGRDFQWLLPETGKIMRSIALDLPGFGRADKPRDFPYSVEGYQTWLSPALEQLGVQRAHLVMHDFGGPIGLMWAAMNPHKFASAVLLDTGVLADYRWHLLGRLWRTQRVGEYIQAGTSRPLFKLWMRRGNIHGLDRQWLNELIDEDEQGNPSRHPEAVSQHRRTRQSHVGSGDCSARQTGVGDLGSSGPIHLMALRRTSTRDICRTPR